MVPGIPVKIILITWIAALVPAMAAEPPSINVTPTSDVSRKLEEHMEMQVKNHRFRGTVLVVQNGRMLLARGYGRADEEWEAANTLHTKFRIGSVTKQFTATLIMQLREKRRLDLRDSICAYLQPCPEEWQPVTLHHLLSHSSGIPGHAERPTGSLATPPWTAEHIAASFRGKPLEFAPGTRWQYSDWGFSLLGLIIEKITGASYEQALRTHILEPLGMHDTGYDHTEMILKQRATGHRLVGDALVKSEYIDMREVYAAGALYSTAADLYKWDQALYSDVIVPRHVLDLMWKDQLANTGYGWFVSNPSADSKAAWWAVSGKFEVAHTGAINGFTAEFLRFPRDHTTVIVLSNLEKAGIIGPFLAAMVFGQEFKMPSR
jgi:CubicO group peptidase (beta-lactamase class C family)